MHYAALLWQKEASDIQSESEKRGGAKDNVRTLVMCVAREAQSPFWQGSRARL